MRQKEKYQANQKKKLNNINSLIVEAVGKGNFSMYRDYSKEGSDTKLKRLVR